jgi:ATP-dependent DNA helicase RecG
MKRTTKEQFESWLAQGEDIDLEFKTASNRFDDKRGTLCDYCAAISNGKGGKLILGASEKNKGIVGTKAYQATHSKLPHELWQKLKLHVDVEEFFYEEKRVLIFHIPCHPMGVRIRGDKYYYPIRRGESFGEMDDQKTREIINEVEPDFTAEIASGVGIGDLDEQAVDLLKKRWAEKAGRKDYLAFNVQKTLKNLGLLTEKGLTYAALIMVGKPEALNRHLADAEIVFEWRQTKRQTHHDFRKNWRAPFILIDDEIWQTINSRNLRIPFQEGFIQHEIIAFDEKSMREAVHNAVMHRDYRVKGRSIFILASPEDFDIESPGSFPPGITPENALFMKAYRNRLLAEVMEKAKMAERSSQGLDDIFEKAIRDGKGMPDLSKSDAYSVRLVIPAQVKDKDFILFLERIVHEKQIGLSFEEILELERIREGLKIERPEFKKKFLELGFIEPVGKGRGTRYILSRRYYETIGQSGKHTRLRGLSRDQMKELILNHIREGKPSSRADLLCGFSEYKPMDISNILQELKRADKIEFKGPAKTGRWKFRN